ncbi:hypothetical protein cand_038850 [Cryptosporidium andersoni]|uniref:Uncharacterized protein n=1 Tax=Cryptosporidium andersoni TaxID=117008 RepID=A0A1J4MF50_9CRYT|nr:hypothetical protein cand_038850 [Cryptosporidium andersoni]
MWTPKVFISEVQNKPLEDGNCYWFQGYITEENLELKNYAVIDDSTGSIPIHIYIDKGWKTDKYMENISEFDHIKSDTSYMYPIDLYDKMVKQLLCRGRYISVICKVINSKFYIIHLSDCVANNPDSETEWLCNILKARFFNQLLE